LNPIELVFLALNVLKVLAVVILYIVTVWSLLIVLNFKKKKVDHNYVPKISLMAYAWQSGNVIERKILNFLEQDYPKDKMEIIIYDNNSTDETEEICRRYERQGLIKYFRSERRFELKAPVLDKAIDTVSTGEFIALTDPDGICEKDWAKKIVQPFVDNRVGAVVGAIHCGNYYKNLFTRFRAIEDEWMTNIVIFGRNGKIKLSRFNLVSGANYALRRSAWEDVGKSHGTSLVEDMEMTAKLYRKNWLIEATDANLWQEEVEDPEEYLRQRRRWYQFSTRDLIGRTNKPEHFMALLPLTLQSSTFLVFLYLLYFLSTLIVGSGFNLAIHWTRLITIFPFILGNIVTALGLKKVGKPKLMPYVLPYFILDGALQVYCFLDARLRCIFGKCSGWAMLAEGKYYHVGTPIRID
jgi:cellulose synthase/poly-beta-1,6-N-acetylglucosamine synthase-like glycosyltransferase